MHPLVEFIILVLLRAPYLLCNNRTAGGKGVLACCWKRGFQPSLLWESPSTAPVRVVSRFSLLCSTGLGWSLALQHLCEDPSLFLLLAATQAAHLLLQLLHLATWPCNQRTAPAGEAAVVSPRERHQASGELGCRSALPLEPWVGQSLCCARGGCSSPHGCLHHSSFDQRDVACFCNTYTYCSLFEYLSVLNRRISTGHVATLHYF